MTTDHNHEPVLVHGQICYLQIPAGDVWVSAQFYEKNFRWRIERPYPSFEAPGLIGQFIDDRPPAPESGPLLWINVDDIAETLTAITADGCEVLETPSLDQGERWLATAQDPAGNTIGLVQLAHA